MYSHIAEESPTWAYVEPSVSSEETEIIANFLNPHRKILRFQTSTNSKRTEARYLTHKHERYKTEFCCVSWKEPGFFRCKIYETLSGEEQIQVRIENTDMTLYSRKRGE